MGRRLYSYRYPIFLSLIIILSTHFVGVYGLEVLPSKLYFLYRGSFDITSLDGPVETNIPFSSGYIEVKYLIEKNLVDSYILNIKYRFSRSMDFEKSYEIERRFVVDRLTNMVRKGNSSFEILIFKNVSGSPANVSFYFYEGYDIFVFPNDILWLGIDGFFYNGHTIKISSYSFTLNILSNVSDYEVNSFLAYSYELGILMHMFGILPEFLNDNLVMVVDLRLADTNFPLVYVKYFDVKKLFYELFYGFRYLDPQTKISMLLLSTFGIVLSISIIKRIRRRI